MNTSELIERVFAETIAAHGGRVYRVGGCVRDAFMGKTPQDIDLCIVGMVKKQFKVLFPAAEEHGKSFPVFRLTIDGVKCELAFARTERKVGSGYKGFKVSSNPKVSIEEDLFRRDVTVNSIAVDSLSGAVIDPFNGIADIKNKILRATSQHFSDDPIRAVRLAAQSARLGFSIDGATLVLAGSVSDELAAEPTERIAAELAKVLAEAQEPARFFRTLAAAKLLQVTFAEITKLTTEQFESAMIKLDMVAKATPQVKLRFAAVGLDLGKDNLARWNSSMTLPGEWLACAIAFAKIVSLLGIPSPENVVAAINFLRRGSLTVEDFDIMTRAMGLAVPVLKPLQAAISVPEGSVPKHLQGKALGEWLKDRQVELVAKLL